MRWLVLYMLLAASCALTSWAQDAASPKPEERATYFLIDASGSMNVGATSDLAEAEVRKILEPLLRQDPGALVSRTYFRAANRDLCSHPIAISEPVSASASARQFLVAGNNDYTPLGTALASAAQKIGDSSASVFIVTDGYQSPDCGADVCAVARELLPRANLIVRVLPVGDDPIVTELSNCIEQAHEKTDTETPGNGVTTEAGPSAWDDADPIERWLWLIITMVICAACVLLGLRDGVRAKDLEYHASSIQENERILLSKPDNAADLRDQINRSSSFKEPEMRVLQSIAWGLLGVSFVAICWLLFVDWSVNGFDLATARAMGWFVLSSNFSTAFAVLVVTPIVFSFSQNWRRLQAKRTFAFVAGLAAQEEAARRRQELDALYKRYLSVRDSVLRAQISSTWSTPSRFAFRSVRKLPEFSDDDLSRIERVKKKLLQIAQGPLLELSGKESSEVTKAIQSIEGFVPRLLGKNWTMDQLIDEIELKGWFEQKATDWTALARAIKGRNVTAIKDALLALD